MVNWIPHDWITSKRKVRLFIFIGICLIGLGAFYLFWVYFAPVAGEAEAKIIHIAPGMNSNEIAKRLKAERLIRSQSAFLTLIKITRAESRLQAGKYKLNPQFSPFKILRKLIRGEVLTKRLVIPEGFTVSQIAQLWEEETLGKGEEFQRVVKDRVIMNKYGIRAPSLEGYLFPATYEVNDGISAKAFVERMVCEFNRRFSQEFRHDATRLKFSLHEYVTLASIIEKEAQVAEERPIISGVFHNRLRRGWRLEADPTVLYALGNPKRKLTRADLKLKSPYNTYMNKGLPPGPICNPGLASLIAALRPVKTSYMYFVAAGDGTHSFSRTLKEHLKKKSERKKRTK